MCVLCIMKLLTCLNFMIVLQLSFKKENISFRYFLEKVIWHLGFVCNNLVWREEIENRGMDEAKLSWFYNCCSWIIDTWSYYTIPSLVVYGWIFLNINIFKKPILSQRPCGS